MEGTRAKRKDTKTFFLLYFLIAFLGWCAETAYFLIRWQDLNDRGFLILPFCSIYGSGAFLVYFVLGTPQGGRLAPLFERAERLAPFPYALARTATYLLYFLGAALLPTLVEWGIALCFDQTCGVRLWSYEYRPMNIRGYVCPSQAILWGVLITLGMRFAWTPLYTAVDNVPQKHKRVLCIALSLATLADFTFNVVYLCITHRRFTLF